MYSWYIKENWVVDRDKKELKKELKLEYVQAYEARSYKTCNGPAYFRWSFTAAELRMIHFLLKEVYFESPMKDAGVLTWKLGDIVYYKPKDLI